MRKSDYALLALAALILAVIVAVAPYAELTAAATSGDVTAIDIVDLTQQAQNLPEQHYAAH